MPLNDKPTLSVVMPNYNHRRFLEKAVRAIADQSRKPMELIIVDDASTDDSFEILTRLSREYPQIVLSRNEKNIGALKSVVLALSKARGTHVLFASSDDILLPGLFEKSMSLLERNPQAGLCTALIQYIDENGEDKGRVPTQIVRDAPGYILPAEVEPLLRKYGSWFTLTAVCRRDAVMEMGGIIPELGNYSDAFLHRALALRYGACFIPEVLGLWRSMPTGLAQTAHGNVMTQIHIARHANGRIKDLVERKIIPGGYGTYWAREWVFNILLRVNYEYRHHVLSLFSIPYPFFFWERLFLWPLLAGVYFFQFFLSLYFFLNVKKESVFDFIQRKFLKRRRIL